MCEYTLTTECGTDECECCGGYDWTEKKLYRGSPEDGELMGEHYGDTHLAGTFNLLEEALWVVGLIEGVDYWGVETEHTTFLVDVNPPPYWGWSEVDDCVVGKAKIAHAAIEDYTIKWEMGGNSKMSGFVASEYNVEEEAARELYDYYGVAH